MWPLDDVSLTQLILAGFTVTAASALSSYLAQRFQARSKPAEDVLAKQVSITFQALEKNAQDAMNLLNRLQDELAKRNKAVKDVERTLRELREQRELLGLTDEQKKAVADFIARQRPPWQSAREIFTSWDFWLGRFLLTTIFFILGVLASIRLK